MHLTVLLCPFGFANTTIFVPKHLELRVDSCLELFPSAERYLLVCTPLWTRAAFAVPFVGTLYVVGVQVKLAADEN